MLSRIFHRGLFGRWGFGFALSLGLGVVLPSAPALAQGSSGSGGGAFFGAIVPIALIFVIMYFLLIRPQQKRQKQHRALVSALKRGDKIVTGGGFFASVVRSVDDKTIEVELAGKLRLPMLRSSVVELISSSGEGSRASKRKLTKPKK